MDANVEDLCLCPAWGRSTPRWWGNSGTSWWPQKSCWSVSSFLSEKILNVNSVVRCSPWKLTWPITRVTLYRKGEQHWGDDWRVWASSWWNDHRISWRSFSKKTYSTNHIFLNYKIENSFFRRRTSSPARTWHWNYVFPGKKYLHRRKTQIQI